MCLFSRQYENQKQKCQKAARKDCSPHQGQTVLGCEPFEGTVHTGRGWVSISIRCSRNYLYIGLENMMLKVASNSRLLMLHTSMFAQRITSPVLWLLKSPVPSPALQDSKREQKLQRRVESKISLFSIHCIPNYVLQRS